MRLFRIPNIKIKSQILNFEFLNFSNDLDGEMFYIKVVVLDEI